MSQSPRAKLLQARSTASKLLEQAESRLQLAPVKPKNQLSRFASMERSHPTLQWLAAVSESFNDSSCQSSAKEPVKTEVLDPATSSSI